jgi:hypothetical protein
MKLVVEGRRYNTDRMIDLGISTREEHGVSIKGVWITPRSRRVVVLTYSIWQRGNSGECIGQTVHIANAAEIEGLAHRFGTPELVALVPEANDADL